MPVTRTCRRCKTKFDPNTTDYIKDNGYIHTQCYTELKLKKGISMDTINENIELIKNQMKHEQQLKEQKEKDVLRQKELAKLQESARKLNKDKFYEYIMEHYSLSVLPKSFFTKVANINNGTHHQVKEPISYEDLLFIFKRRAGYLYKVHMRNIEMGNELTGINRLNYDLAVVLNMYDNFKEWKRQQAVLEAELRSQQKQAENTIKIDYKKINKNNKHDNSDDILDILDELY